MKTALITGGSYGLGFEMSKYLAEKGYVPIILSRQKSKIDTAVNAIKDMGYETLGFPCDITDGDALKGVFESIKNKFDKLDYLILNAGVSSFKLLTNYDSFKEVRRDIDVNLLGTMLSAYTFIPLLQENSKVIIVSSGFGFVGTAGYSSYCASKAGLISFGETLRRELLYKKIHVYVACPNVIDTPMFEEEKSSWTDEWKKKKEFTLVAMPADLIAKRILKKSEGKRFLVLTDFSMSFMLFCFRIFPERIKNFVMDRIFAKP